MGKKLAINTSNLLSGLAVDCERIQSVIGSLISGNASSNGGTTSLSIDVDTMRELQGLDRIAQLLRDVAAVQQELAGNGNLSDEISPPNSIHVALLEETRVALSSGYQVFGNATPAPKEAMADQGDCMFF